MFCTTPLYCQRGTCVLLDGKINYVNMWACTGLCASVWAPSAGGQSPSQAGQWISHPVTLSPTNHLKIHHWFSGPPCSLIIWFELISFPLMFCSKPLGGDIDDSLFTGRYTIHASTTGLYSESTHKNKYKCILIIYFKTLCTVHYWLWLIIHNNSL